MNMKQSLIGFAIVLVVALATVLLLWQNRAVAQSKAPLFKQDPALGIDFQGKMNFVVDFLDTGYRPDMPPCPATAALVHLDGDTYELRLSEGGPCGGRLSIWNLTIDKEGNVSGEAWANVIHPPLETSTMLGQNWLHTGCKEIGVEPLFPGISGSWDGTTLIADTNIEGYCEGGTWWGGPEFWGMFLDVETENGGSLADGVSWDDGRVHLRFGAELTVAE
ncbi:MAG TPA: hypothetical protein P5121_18230 [Caldilineaceae bacterium]|nr:hypothetical protein [Caldilineaceae bacterium]